MPDLRTLASSLLAGAGIWAVALGFASWAWDQNTTDGFKMAGDLFESINLRFDEEEDIDIPFPHQTVFVKNS